ncbi:hypothetical protein KAV79_01215 [Candidatus Aerophobetes bacterium]|nr:hypothetical protein [Candidatus Aerophobetes bacterium]
MNPKENLMKVIRCEEPEWVPCPMVDGSWRVVFHSLVERTSEAGFDDWRVHWKLSDRAGGTYPDQHPITNPEMVKDFPLPDGEIPSLTKPALEMALDIDRDKSLLLGDNGWGIFERSWLLAGMDNLLIWMVEEPEAVNILMHRIARVKLRITERLIDEVGVDGIRYGDDWGGEKALIMGPHFWRKFIKPQQRLLYNACKKKDIFILQHSDGHTEEIIPDLIEMGLDILNPLQPECNDIEKIKAEFGKDLAFHGAVSSRTLDKSTPEKITQEVKLRISQLAQGGGYILAPAHGFPYPASNLQAFRTAAIEYGKIPKEWRGEFEVQKTDVEI